MNTFLIALSKMNLVEIFLKFWYNSEELIRYKNNNLSIVRKRGLYESKNCKKRIFKRRVISAFL